MDTIGNTPGEPGDGSAGWALMVVILLVAIAGLALWYARYRPVSAAPGAAAQVNLPTGGADNSGSSTPVPAQ